MHIVSFLLDYLKYFLKQAFIWIPNVTQKGVSLERLAPQQHLESWISGVFPTLPDKTGSPRQNSLYKQL